MEKLKKANRKFKNSIIEKIITVLEKNNIGIICS